MLNKIKEFLKPDKYIYGLFVIYISIMLLVNSIALLNVPNLREVLIILSKIIKLCYLGFGIKIIYDIIKKHYITWSMILIPYISFMVMLFSKNRELLLLAFILLALRHVDLQKLIKYTLRIILPMFLIIVILSLFNIFPNWTYYRGDFIRYSVGFAYPTDAIGYYLLIILMYCYTRREKCTYLELFVLEAFNIFLYAYTNGRLSFLLVTAILTTMFFYKVLHNNKKIKKMFYSKTVQKTIKILCFSLPIVLFLFVLVLTYFYGTNNSLAITIDNLLSGRLRLNNEAFEKYPITLFGSSIQWQGWGGYGYAVKEPLETYEYNFVDMSYIRIVFDYGTIATVLIIIGYTIALLQNYNKKDYWSILVLCFVLIWAFVEPHIVKISTNFLVVLLAPLLEIGRIKIKKA